MATYSTPSLFPTFPLQRDSRPDPLPPDAASNSKVGIARLAATSPEVGESAGVDYFLMPARTIINRCHSTRVPYPWTVNPYRGCEFGCHYCYARYTHEFMDLDGGDFERKIFVKENAGGLAARELRTKGLRGEHIAIGAATDPYQPAEREFGATRAVLEQMALRSGLSVSITTKSDRVVRDLDLLKRIHEKSHLEINITVTTPRIGLARILEPRAPRPDLRIAAIRELREAGLQAGMFVMPILPRITDREQDLEALARAARDAGAQWFAANVLYLMPAARREFLPFLNAKFPRLAHEYREWYEGAGYAPNSYKREIGQRIAALRTKYGLRAWPESQRLEQAPVQLTLGTALPRTEHPGQAPNLIGVRE